MAWMGIEHMTPIQEKIRGQRGKPGKLAWICEFHLIEVARGDKGIGS